MKRSQFIWIGVALVLVVCAIAVPVLAKKAGSGGEPLFKFRGKIFTTMDIPAALQQAVFDVDSERYEKMTRIADAAVLEAYFDEEAKKEKKTREQIEQEKLAVPTPSEQEIQAFYDKNKDRIPYKFDQIKGQIVNLLQSQGREGRRNALLDEIKKVGGFAVVAAEPMAPVVDIKVDGFFAMGPANAKVTLVQFTDYKCPHCKALHESLRTVIPKFQDKVKFVFMDFPLRAGASQNLAEAAYCALEQKKYVEFHSMAFDKQAETKEDSGIELARALQLDEKAFGDCMGSPRAKDYVSKVQAEGNRIGVSGTPSIYVNGRRLPPGYTVEILTAAIEKALK